MKKIGLLTTNNIVFIGLLYTAVSSQAQENPGFALGPFDVSPGLDIEVVRDDNIFQTADNAVSDTITRVSPGVSLVFDNGISGFALDYRLNTGYYSESTSEDYIDQSLASTFGWAVNDIHRVEFDVSLLKSHDDRSLDNASQTGAVVNTDNELDEFDEWDYAARYILGNSGSLLTLTLNAGLSEKTYTSNRASTRENDFEATRYGSQLSWPLTPDLSVFAALNQVEVEYTEDNNSANSDSDTLTYDVGVNWGGDRQLTGSIALGNSERDAEDDADSSDTSRWRVSLSWAPLSYSTFSLSSSREQYETSGQNGVQQGDFVDVQSLSLSWSHDWTRRLTSRITVDSAETDYIGDPREDETESYNLGVNYNFSRWLTAGLFVGREERDSTDSDSSYDGNLYGLNLSFTM